MSTEATLARHLRAFAEGVDSIMSDYTEDEDVAFIIWKAEPFIPLASDTFVIRGGKILAQSFVVLAPPLAAS